MKRKPYAQHYKTITVRHIDDPKEWSRQYYWIVKKGFAKAPPKRKAKNNIKKDKEGEVNG